MENTLSHSKFDFSYHILFVPKMRKKVLVGERVIYLSKCFKSIALKHEMYFDKLKIGNNYVQMLLCIPPKMSVSMAMQKIKGLSAYLMLKKFPELRDELPEGTFWARGYYAKTVGKLEDQDIKNYIKNIDFL